MTTDHEAGWKDCPDCDGGSVEERIICMGCDPDSEDHQHPAPTQYKCPQCRGTGRLSSTAYACRIALGRPFNVC